MAALYATAALLGAGPSHTFYLAGVQDANGHLAIAETLFYQTASGILVPAPVDANANPVTVGTAVGPTQIASIPYTAFTASATYYAYYPAVLHRHVRARTLLVVNALNESLTSVGWYPYDSTTQSGNPSGVTSGFTWGSGPGPNGVWVQTSEQASAGPAGALAAHVDSFQLGLGMGATAPTSGEVTVWIVEAF